MTSGDGWDIVVVGAGPAGSVAARELARGGARVLLVDRARFPRHKVCGCCISAAALRSLDEIGLGGLAVRLGARLTREFKLYSGGRVATTPIPAGISVSRQALDYALAQEAVRSGATFRDGTNATVDAGNLVLRTASAEERLEPRLVIAADGLAGALLPQDRVLVARRSYMGLGAIVPGASVPSRGDGWALPGVIHMACGRGGYVGMVELEDGELNVASALNPGLVRARGGPAPAVAAVLRDAGCPEPDSLKDATWHGTPLLTRRRRELGAHRLLALGDSAGYVEPFTGEGIAWAIATARAIVPFALRAVECWDDRLVSKWTAAHRRLVGGRQSTCRMVVAALRSSALRRTAVWAIRHAPRATATVIRRIHAPIGVGRGRHAWA